MSTKQLVLENNISKLIKDACRFVLDDFSNNTYYHYINSPKRDMDYLKAIRNILKGITGSPYADGLNTFLDGFIDLVKDGNLRAATKLYTDYDNSLNYYGHTEQFLNYNIDIEDAKQLFLVGLIPLQLLKKSQIKSFLKIAKESAKGSNRLIKFAVSKEFSNSSLKGLFVNLGLQKPLQDYADYLIAKHSVIRLTKEDGYQHTTLTNYDAYYTLNSSLVDGNKDLATNLFAYNSYEEVAESIRNLVVNSSANVDDYMVNYEKVREEFLINIPLDERGTLAHACKVVKVYRAMLYSETRGINFKTILEQINEIDSSGYIYQYAVMLGDGSIYMSPMSDTVNNLILRYITNKVGLAGNHSHYRRLLKEVSHCEPYVNIYFNKLLDTKLVINYDKVVEHARSKKKMCVEQLLKALDINDKALTLVEDICNIKKLAGTAFKLMIAPDHLEYKGKSIRDYLLTTEDKLPKSFIQYPLACVHDLAKGEVKSIPSLNTFPTSRVEMSEHYSELINQIGRDNKSNTLTEVGTGRIDLDSINHFNDYTSIIYPLAMELVSGSTDNWR